MYEAVLQVKKNLSIFYDVLHITVLDNLSYQSYGTMRLYAGTKNWKQDLLKECWDIVKTTRRSKYFKVRQKGMCYSTMRKIFLLKTKTGYTKQITRSIAFLNPKKACLNTKTSAVLHAAAAQTTITCKSREAGTFLMTSLKASGFEKHILFVQQSLNLNKIVLTTIRSNYLYSRV